MNPSASLVISQTNNVIDAIFAGNFCGAIGAAIIDDQDLNFVNPGDLLGQRFKRHR
jgi:hypothetical protein